MGFIFKHLGNFIKGINEVLYIPKFLELYTIFFIKNKNLCDSKMLEVYQPFLMALEYNFPNDQNTSICLGVSF